MRVKTDTIVRTVLLVLALVNQALSICGKAVLPISDEQAEQLTTLLLTVAASLWAWWKNNSFTKAAREADEVMQQLREEAKTNGK